MFSIVLVVFLLAFPPFFVDIVSLCYTVWPETHRDPPNSVSWVLGFIDWFFICFYSFFHGLQFWQFILQCLLAPRGFP